MPLPSHPHILPRRDLGASQTSNHDVCATRLPDKIQKLIAARYQIVKARGKASIISLVKYLRELNIAPVVVHDGDYGTAGAEKFNKPIGEAVGKDGVAIVLDKCLEEALGYVPPDSDKPFRAFSHTSQWRSPDDVPAKWMKAISEVFADVLKE
jgi:hypothetical protein